MITISSEIGTLTSFLPSALAERSAAPVRDDPNLTETGASMPPVILLSVLPFGPMIYRWNRTGIVRVCVAKSDYKKNLK